MTWKSRYWKRNAKHTKCANIIRLNVKSTCGIVYAPWRAAYGTSSCVLVNEVRETSTYIREQISLTWLVHRPFRQCVYNRTHSFLYIIYVIKFANCYVKWKFKTDINRNAFFILSRQTFAITHNIYLHCIPHSPIVNILILVSIVCRIQSNVPRYNLEY